MRGGILMNRVVIGAGIVAVAAVFVVAMLIVHGSGEKKGRQQARIVVTVTASPTPKPALTPPPAESPTIPSYPSDTPTPTPTPTVAPPSAELLKRAIPVPHDLRWPQDPAGSFATDWRDGLTESSNPSDVLAGGFLGDLNFCADRPVASSSDVIEEVARTFKDEDTSDPTLGFGTAAASFQDDGASPYFQAIRDVAQDCSDVRQRPGRPLGDGVVRITYVADPGNSYEPPVYGDRIFVRVADVVIETALQSHFTTHSLLADRLAQKSASKLEDLLKRS